MKLGISYNLFDGEELLKYSISSIRNSVDYISVIYQTVSNFGEKCSENLIELLQTLQKDGLINELYYYEPVVNNNLNATNQNQEVTKRNIGVELSRKNNCTHHMVIDTDEFYVESEFKNMKSIIESGFDTGYCKHIQYYKDSIYRKDPMEEEYVETIFALHENTKICFNQPCVVPVDPSRKSNNINFRIFNRSEIQMHHMSFVRNNLRKKLMNHTSRPSLMATNEMVCKYYETWQYPNPIMWAGGAMVNVVQVPRLFNIKD